MRYSTAQARELINRIGPVIKAEGGMRGYRVFSTVIAQAVVESAAGTSGLARYHNYFGMKCGAKWAGASVNIKTKEEYTPGVLTAIKDNFRVYDSLEDGVRGYYDFISASRYSNLKTAADYKEYATLLKKDGYATSSLYVDTLCKTVKKYNLDRCDGDVKADRDTLPTLKRGSRGAYVKELQTMLNYSCTSDTLVVDGVFGYLTQIALISYQSMTGLKADGICGPKTWARLKAM